MSAFQAVDSVLPAVLVGVVALAVAALSWQTTAKIIGSVLLMVILPLSWFIKDAPESMGLKRPPSVAPAPQTWAAGSPQASDQRWKPSLPVSYTREKLL
jgi:sugar phosphate permease